MDNVKADDVLNNDVPPELIIRAGRGLATLSFRELWEYREVLYFMAWRDITVRYKQTLLGVLWAIIQPVCAMLVFTLIFSRLGKISSDGLPYPLFSYAGLLPWIFFANSVSHASNCLVDNRLLLSRVYFPRLLIPLSVVMAGLVDFVLALFVLIGLMFYYRHVPNVHAIFAICFMMLAFTLAVGVGMWLAALNVQFRDVRYVTPFLIQLWLFSTPVIYPSSILPENWRVLYGLNPMVAVVDGFRWSLLGTNWNPGPAFFLSTGVALLLLISGALYFLYTEHTFADVA